jgi:hypothetical protein
MYTYNFANRIQQLGLVSYTLNIINKEEESLNTIVNIIISKDQDTKEYLDTVAQNIINQQIYIKSAQTSVSAEASNIIEEDTAASLHYIDTTNVELLAGSDIVTDNIL